MQLKTLFSLLIVSCFLCACANNNNTEKVEEKNIATAANIQATASNNSTLEQEDLSPKIIKYGEDKIWHTINYFMTDKDAKIMTKNNPQFMEDAKKAFSNSIYYNLVFYIGMDGEELFINENQETEFGYAFELRNCNEGETVAKYVIDNGGGQLLISADGVKETDKFYALFRKNKGTKEFVINRVNNNKIVQEYVFLASHNFFMTDILAGQYMLDNTDKIVSLMANETMTGFKDFKHFFIKFPDKDIPNTLAIICSKCPSDSQDNCNYLAAENSKIYALKYKANTRTLELYNIKNIERCLENGAYPNPADDIDGNEHILYCPEFEIGTLAHTLKLKQ